MGASPSDPDRGCVATIAAETTGEDILLFSICSRALAATAPLLGKSLLCESGFNTSHAEAAGGGGGENDLDVAFSIADIWDHESNCGVDLKIRLKCWMASDRRNRQVTIVLIANKVVYSDHADKDGRDRDRVYTS